MLHALETNILGERRRHGSARTSRCANGCHETATIER